jgi:hypothetical protein
VQQGQVLLLLQQAVLVPLLLPLLIASFSCRRRC